MKIGVFTFHRPINYGAVLQAFAMTKIFGQYGEVQVIDYYPKSEKDIYSLLDRRFLGRSTTFTKRVEFSKVTFKKLLLLPIRMQKQLKYRSFISEYIPLSQPYTDTRLPLPVCDTYVYGSDQIWRSHGTNANNEPITDLIYFGANIPIDKKKVAYAASCGSLVEGFFENSVIKQLLNSFTRIGARELYLTAELRKRLDNEVTDVLDPTMLVKSEEWTAIANKVAPLEKKPYLLIYNLAPSVVASKIAKNISEKLGLKIIELNGYDSFSSVFLKRESINNAGPIEFLNLIHNASYVITSSYHGVIFSMLFKKQYYASGMTGRSDRVESLLKKLDISNRLIADESGINLADQIDYKALEVTLNGLINASKDFIKKSMS